MIRRENSEERIFIQIWVLTENSGESGKSGNFWHHNQKLERTYFWLHGEGGEECDRRIKRNAFELFVK